MRLHLTALITTAFAVAILSCQPDQAPTPLENDDAPSRVQFPDIRAVAAKSVTPAGALDQLVRKSTVQYSSGGYSDSTRTQFFYNAAGQITGYQDLYLGQAPEGETQQQLDRLSAYGVVYEYKNNRPYRIYSKSYNSMVRPYQDLSGKLYKWYDTFI
jgi:hypothetical protein